MGKNGDPRMGKRRFPYGKNDDSRMGKTTIPAKRKQKPRPVLTAAFAGLRRVIFMKTMKMILLVRVADDRPYSVLGKAGGR